MICTKKFVFLVIPLWFIITIIFFEHSYKSNKQKETPVQTKKDLFGVSHSSKVAAHVRNIYNTHNADALDDYHQNGAGSAASNKNSGISDRNQVNEGNVNLKFSTNAKVTEDIEHRKVLLPSKSIRVDEPKRKISNTTNHQYSVLHLPKMKRVPRKHRMKIRPKKRTNRRQGGKTAIHQPLEGRMRRVLIVAIGRSGSTLIGDLFDFHKDTMYYFEPLHPLHYFFKWRAPEILQDPDKLNNITVEYLNEFFECNITDKNKYLFNYFAVTADRLRTLSLTGPPFCSVTKQDCKHLPINTSLLYHVCHKERTHTVIKELITDRMPFNIKGILNGMGGKTQTILLVRDPRAIFTSWWFSGWFSQNDTKGNYAEIKNNCQALLTAVRYAKRKEGPLMKIFRYEDICMNFEEEAEKIIRFTGLPVYNEFREFLSNKSGIRNVTDKNTAEFAYSTHRDMKHQVNSWRKKIPLFLARFIENECSELLDITGYRNTYGHENILRDTQVQLF